MNGSVGKKGPDFVSGQAQAPSKESHDSAGVEWARLSQLKPGDKLRTDGGFDCIEDGAVVTVRARSDGELYVDCSEGGHTLDGQADNGDHLIGMYALNADAAHEKPQGQPS